MPADAEFDVLAHLADGELSAEEQAVVEARVASDPTAARQVESIRELRSRIAAIMAHPKTAPPDLADTVRDLLAEHRAPRAWWTGPRRANVFAVAASLALVAGAVLFGLFGPRIIGRHSPSMDTLVTDVATWVASEHQHCTSSSLYRDRKRAWPTIEAATSGLSERLGVPACVPDLSSLGFVFSGGGPCMVPGAEWQSAHLLYERHTATGTEWLSTFVVPASTAYLVVDAYGRTMPLMSGANHTYREPGGADLLYWTDGLLTWFVECDGSADLDAIRAHLACP